MAGQDRTESATPRRRAEARRRGQVARSPELTSAILLTGTLLLLRVWATSFYGQFSQLVRGTFSLIASPQVGQQTLPTDLVSLGLWFVGTIGPLLIALLLIGVVVNLGQTGLLFTTVPLTPDFSRLNPLRGFQRMFSAHSLVELLKALAKMAIVSFIVYQSVASHVSDVMLLAAIPIGGAVSLIFSMIYTVLIDAGIALLVIAAIDYAYQRYQFEKSIQMSKDELREEFRQTEGNPQIRLRIRQRQRQMARQRMMQQVPKAAVVITNPTHLAIALRYDEASPGAPRVIAKGADFVAQQIRRIAQENDVPIVENKPLAQALFKQVDLDQEIPAELYRAVAEVLAFILMLKQRRTAPAPTTSRVATLPMDRPVDLGWQGT